MDNKISSTLRYIVPFSFDSDVSVSYDNVCSLLASHNAWEASTMWSKEVEQDLYDYIIDQFIDRGDTTNIASTWHYRNISSLPKLTYKPKRPKNKQSYSVAFSDMGLFIFRSRIGILWYELEDPEFDDVDEIVLFQNIFKEFNLPIDKQRIFLKEDSDEPFYLGVLIDDIIRDLPCRIHYFAQRKCVINHSDSEGRALPVPDKALLFSYIAIPCKSELNTDHNKDLIRWTYYLSNGYSHRHLVKDDIESDLLHPYLNTYWNLSNEGSACCTHYDERNNIFFNNLFISRFKYDYFLVYIILLHQSYSLLNFSTWIEKNLPANEAEYVGSKNKHRVKLEQLLLNLNTFLSKNIYASVSHIQHQNDYYSYGLNRLKIHDDIKSVNLGIDAINEILEVHENRREATDDSTRNFIFGILSLLVVFSALTDFNSLFDIKQDARLENPIYWGFMVFIVALPIAAIISLLIMSYRKRKGKRQ